MHVQAHPMIAQATLNIVGLMILIHASRLMPNLTHLRYSDARTPDYAEAVNHYIAQREGGHGDAYTIGRGAEIETQVRRS
jgi:hypothetical protein